LVAEEPHDPQLMGFRILRDRGALDRAALAHAAPPPGERETDRQRQTERQIGRQTHAAPPPGEREREGERGGEGGGGERGRMWRTRQGVACNPPYTLSQATRPTLSSSCRRVDDPISYGNTYNL